MPTEQKGAELAFLGSMCYPDLFFSWLGVGWGQEVFLCALESALLLNCIWGPWILVILIDFFVYFVSVSRHAFMYSTCMQEPSAAGGDWSHRLL